MKLEDIMKLKKDMLNEEPIRETCPDCNGVPREHDGGSGLWLWCPTCDHKGYFEHYPLRDKYKKLLWFLSADLLNLWDAAQTADAYNDILNAVENLEARASTFEG